MTEQEIITGVRAGDSAALEALGQYISSHRTSYGDDIRQDAFITIWAIIRRGEEIRSLRGLTGIVMLRKQGEFLKRTCHQRECVTDAPFVCPAPNPLQQLLAQERKQRGLRAVDAMPPGLGKEILTRVIAGQTEAEIRRDVPMTDTQFRLYKSRAKRHVMAKAA